VNNSNWTGRVPRDLQEAFGPYTDRNVYDTTSHPAWHRWAYGVACIAAVVLVGYLLSKGVV
jgi:hypothetical protein